MNLAPPKRAWGRAYWGPPVCLFLMAALAFGQPAAKKPIRTISPLPTAQKTTMNFSEMPGLPPPRSINFMPSPNEQTWMQFSLDWTHCQIHRVNDNSPIVLILPGTVNGSGTLYWNLEDSTPTGRRPLCFYFEEDIFGHAGLQYGADIPLSFEISLDGGAFTPMTMVQSNAITTTFPSGQHTFQVRITGIPQPYQADGYYHLQLTQCLVPQL